MLYFYLVFKNKRLKSQGGFVLIAALMAVMILIAVGFFALTVTTQDMRVSARLVGERKAFSAAEAGVNEICRSIDPFNMAVITGQKIDVANDPTAEFDATIPVRTGSANSIQFPGMPLIGQYAGAVFKSTVTGRDTSYDSEASIDIGVVIAPQSTDTRQDEAQGGGG